MIIPDISFQLPVSDVDHLLFSTKLLHSPVSFPTNFIFSLLTLITAEDYTWTHISVLERRVANARWKSVKNWPQQHSLTKR
jgi:hypothetical protein